MGRQGFFDRVRSWFGRQGDAGGATGPSTRRCSLEPVTADAQAAFERTGAATVATATTLSVSEELDPFAEERSSAALSPAADGMARPPAPTHLDPLDPTWMQSLEELPRRIAESAIEAAGSARALHQIASELGGHRQTSRVVMDAVRRLPDLAANQAELTRGVIKALDREALLLEALYDGLTGMRASFRTVEESSRRHVMALAQLETSHRQVLLEYQGMLVRTHRKLAWLAFGGVVLGAAALGGVAYAIVTVFAR
jgi:hypothetical protein